MAGGQSLQGDGICVEAVAPAPNSTPEILAAAEQYRGALMWAPEDAAIRAKLADIYLTLAKAHYDKREYAGAEARLVEAAKFVDKDSPQGRTLADYQQRLSAIRR